MNDPESLLAEALHHEELCWTGVDDCQGVADHGEAKRLAAHAPLRDALTRGLALTPRRLAAALHSICEAEWDRRENIDPSWQGMKHGIEAHRDTAMAATIAWLTAEDV